MCADALRRCALLCRGPCHCVCVVSVWREGSFSALERVWCVEAAGPGDRREHVRLRKDAPHLLCNNSLRYNSLRYNSLRYDSMELFAGCPALRVCHVIARSLRHTLHPRSFSKSRLFERSSSGAGVAAPQSYVSPRVERAVRAPRRVRGSVMTPWTPLDSSSDERLGYGGGGEGDTQPLHWRTSSSCW